jgi:outer membrane protein TolC
LWRNGPIDRRRAELVRAEAQTTIAEAALQLQRLEASQQAIQRYWDWVAAGQQVAIARRWLNLARKRDADLATGIRTGALPALERQENERAIQQREGYLAQAERGLERSAIALSLFLRDEKGSPRLPSPAQLPPELPPARHLSEALVQADLTAVAALRPEPRQVEAQLEQARVDLALAENQLAPALDLSFQGSQDLGAGQVGRATPELEAGVLVDVPLIARTPRGKIAQSQAKVKGLEAKLRFAQDKARAGVKDAASAVVAATRRAVAAKGERDVAERLAVLEAERLRLGEGSLFIVNLREQAAADAAVREAIALGEHQRARVVYETSAGRIPTGDTPQQDG